MTPARNAALLAGQTALAQKIYAVLPADRNTAFTALRIAQAMKDTMGGSPDIHTMRGCLGALRDAGLIKEVVPGSFRRVEVKEKLTMAIQGKRMMSNTHQGTEPVEVPGGAKHAAPIDVLAIIAAKVRAAMAGLGTLAEEIDQAAIMIEERSAADAKELAKVKQIATLLKELG